MQADTRTNVFSERPDFETAPKLRLLEIGLLMKLDPTTPIYAVVEKKKIGIYSRELRRAGYDVGLFTRVDKSENEGRYVLEVRRDANRS